MDFTVSNVGPNQTMLMSYGYLYISKGTSEACTGAKGSYKYAGYLLNAQQTITSGPCGKSLSLLSG